MGRSIQPVLVGVGQTLDRPTDLSEARSPLEMMRATSLACADDAGISSRQLEEIDTLAVVNTVGPRLMTNPPARLADAIGAGRANQYLTSTGGNTPQMLVNHFAKEIVYERTSMVLLSGAEALDSLSRSSKTDYPLNWVEEEGAETKPANRFSEERPGTNDTEAAHNMVAPIVTYPLFENALRRHYDISLEEHQREIGKLFARFSEIAKDNPYSWFPTARSAEEIALPTIENRYVGFPYTKFMNAVMQINQSASVLMMSDVKARSLGIDESKWVYLHGHCDIDDIWNVCERINFHSSRALEIGLSKVFDMAKTTADEIDFFDIYSCFPAIVEITRDILGMKPSDPRPLTVTGGLPYFGGAGNNYSMHAIATMVERLRKNPGSLGLVTANGWYLTKHALALYSTTRPNSPFDLSDATALNAEIASLAHPIMDPKPEGKGVVDTFTVIFGRDGQPEYGLVIGTLYNSRRFVAHIKADRELLEKMTREDPIGLRGTVVYGETINVFDFD